MANDSDTAAPALPWEPDPDVAGIGIVIASLITAWLSILLSMLAMWGHVRLRFLVLGMTPNLLNTTEEEWTSKHRKGLSSRMSAVLMETISALGEMNWQYGLGPGTHFVIADVTQFATSIGILIALIVTYPNSKDPHAILAIGLAVLASSSQLISFTVLLASGTLHKAASANRAGLGLVQTVITLALFFAWYNHGDKHRAEIFGAMSFINVFMRLSYLGVFLFPIYLISRFIEWQDDREKLREASHGDSSPGDLKVRQFVRVLGRFVNGMSAIGLII